MIRFRRRRIDGRRQSIRWTRTLRGQLTATVTGTFLVIIALLMVAWQAASSAGDVVSAAAEIHQRTQAYSRLQMAADQLQRASYAVVWTRDGNEQTRLRDAQEDYETALATVVSLPVRSPREIALKDRVQELGTEVRTLLSSAATVVNAVDQRWKDAGSNAALGEVDRLSAPYFALVATITEEIRLGDRELKDATSRADDLRARLAMAGVAVFFLCTVFAGLSLMLVLTRLSPALKALEMGVSSVGQDGARPEKITMRGQDELARLATAFNVMTERLDAQQNELMQISSGLEKAVIDRTAELAKLHDEVAWQDRRRREFIAEISHELRTPIAIIRGEAQVAQRTLDNSGLLPPPALERILTQTRHLGRLVNDLFLLAKAEAGGLELHREPVDLGRLASEVVSDFDPIIGAKQGHCKEVLLPGIWVNADRDRLRQIIAALLDNALRHTQPGVCIELEVGRDPDGNAAIRVKDDGPGVDEETLTRLFSRFQRGTRRVEGSGLGLSIVKALAEAHGGSASLRSSLAQGFEATITLPPMNNMDGKQEHSGELADV